VVVELVTTALGDLSSCPHRNDTPARAERSYMVDLRKPRSTLDAARVANASMVMTYDRSRILRRAGRVSIEAMSSPSSLF
jgi:hypothetical protein